MAPPFKVAEFDIMYNEGISKVGDLLDLGVEYDVIEKRGAYYRFEDELIGQGREASKEFLRNHPEIADKIDRIVRERAGLVVRPASEESGESKSLPA